MRWQQSEARHRFARRNSYPLAEEIGLIVQIGEWVLHKACQLAVSWPEPLKVAVNISAVQFKGRQLVQAVTRALQESGLDPARLELEITESVMIHDFDSALSVLHQLKNLGVSISMDDFGTGYSSLSYLRSFPFDKIKIDQSFVRELGNKSDCKAIIRAVTGMCESLGITATAEGVETTQQLSLLQAERCTEIQGYLVSKPRPAIEIPNLIRDFRRNLRQELFPAMIARVPSLVPEPDRLKSTGRMKSLMGIAPTRPLEEQARRSARILSIACEMANDASLSHAESAPTEKHSFVLRESDRIRGQLRRQLMAKQ